MKQRSKLSTLVSLATALDVNFSLFDALDEAEAAATKRAPTRKHPVEMRSVRQNTMAFAAAR